MKIFKRNRYTGQWIQAVAALFLGVNCLLASPSPALAQPRLPTMGDGGELSTGEERRLGDRIIRTLYRDPDYLDDPALAEYVQGLWQPLLAAARTRGELSQELDERFAWEVLLGRDRTVNAFALPGGYLGVHLGLIAVVATRDELASVLAHELSHVTQRHIARMLAQQSRQGPLLLGAMAVAVLAASKSPQATQALVVGGQALAIQSQLNFSRDMEREADRIGFTLMEPAGFAPQGFVTMFEKLQQANRLNDNGSWPYLRSHPLSTQRMTDMQARVPAGTPAAPPSTLEHGLMTARARVLANPSPDVLRQWMAEPQGPGFARLAPARQAAALYAAALGQRQLRQFDAARASLARLEAVVRDDAPALRQARLLGAELALAAGQPEQVLSSIPAPAPYAQARPELLLRSEALLALGRADQAHEALQSWLARHPRDATAWQTLSRVWAAQGKALRAVRAEAEAQAVRYDYGAAVDRLKAGQDLARRSSAPEDYIEASIIDTRLRTLQSLLREQAAER